MSLFRLVPTALIACAAVAQSPQKVEFEVASIRPAAPLSENVHIGLHADGSQVAFTGFSLKDYIRIAYRVKDYQVTGPDWIGSERFDIAGKMPAGSNRDQVNDMLQALLADRFKLTFHREKKEFPVYALVVTKGGLKAKVSPLDADDSGAANPGGAPTTVAASGSRDGVSVALDHGSAFSFANNKFEGRKLTMARLADVLARFLDRPVVDMTNAEGTYDVTFEVTPEDYRGMLIRSAITAGVALPPEAQRLAISDISESLASSMAASGLKLDSRKAPLDVIVVDHAEHKPTEN